LGADHLVADFADLSQVRAPAATLARLIDVLVDSRATVVNTSRSSQRLLRHVTVADFHTTRRRRAGTAHAFAKLANVLFTPELHRRHGAAGRSPVRRRISTPDRGADQLFRLASSTPGVDWAAAVGWKCPLATPMGTNDPRMRHGSA